MKKKNRATEERYLPDSVAPSNEAEKLEHEPRGETACDRNESCEGEGKEGFTAQLYPGENPMRGETEEEYQERIEESLGPPESE